MRATMIGVAVLALLAVEPGAVREAVTIAGAVLAEAAPMVGLAALLGRLGRPSWAAYLGCGCGRAPGALSIPVAVATTLAFGPAVAALRFGAAIMVARLRPTGEEEHRPHVDPLGDLYALVPAALLAGAIAAAGLGVRCAAWPPIVQALAGAALGLVASPCTFGAIAMAATLSAHAPWGAAGVLCTAGIAGRGIFARRCGSGAASPATQFHDPFAYALLGAALATIAAKHGDALVHPRWTIALGACALVAAAASLAMRRCSAPRARIAPCIVAIAAMTGAPAPLYQATETTLAQQFPGERITFTGRLVREGSVTALERYAIACCRADATPVVVRLARAPNEPDGTWMRAEGQLDEQDGSLMLRARNIVDIAPPVDPFVYR